MSLLLVAATTGYQTRAFDDAASKLGVELALATDRCHRLDDPWRDRAVAVRFHDTSWSVDAIRRAAGKRAIEGVLAVGDRPAVIAAHAARALSLRWHPPDAAEAARHKLWTRQRLQQGRLPVPAFEALAPDRDPESLVPEFPVVVKPVALSGSRGVIRADSPDALRAAVARVRRLLDRPDVRALRDPDSGLIVVERFLSGPEYALEGLVTEGRLRVLAVFDKPDPLEGPFFEETIYVTPSRAPARRLAALTEAVERAVAAIGLTDGPIHAECRVEVGPGSGRDQVDRADSDDGARETVYVIEIAARPIGGLCARALRFTDGNATVPLEELLLRHALGERVDGWERETDASAVMMIPIPRTGIFRGVSGEDEARTLDGITDVRITARRDQLLHALPEGSTYLGFLFARASTPSEAEAVLREAHRRLRFRIDRPLLSGD